jgi:hypothetical protein
LQQFATSPEKTLSSETFIIILETVFAALRYAIKPGMKTASVTFSDLTVKAPDARLQEGEGGLCAECFSVQIPESEP